MAEMLPQISFGKLEAAMPMPHLLDIQTRAFERLLRPETEKGEDDIGLDSGVAARIQDLAGADGLDAGHGAPSTGGWVCVHSLTVCG